MRTSILLTAIVTAPLLAVVACGATHHEPIEGTVIEKEYKPAKTKKVTGYRTRTVTVTSECYELDIDVDADDIGEQIAICDRDAYNTLAVGDRYSSAVDYSLGAKQ